MNEADAVELARDVTALAVGAGADSAETTVSITRRFHAEARERTVSKLEQSTGKSLHLRVFCGGRKATLTTSDLSREGLRDGVSHVVAQAAFVAADELAALPDTFATDAVDLGLYDAAITDRETGEKVEEALQIERLVRQGDARIVNSNGSHYNDTVAIFAIANSSDFAAVYTSTRAGRSTSPVALDGEIKRTAHYGTAARHLAELEDAQVVANVAARRAVESFGARKPATMRLPVIFERDVAASILDDIFAAISASNVAVGNSWLIGRTGTRIGSEHVTIVDDGRLHGKLGSSPFDGEGVATRRTPVFVGGVLQSFLYDTYYARKLGAASTGNSTGSGIGANSFYLEPGTRSLAELVAATPRGVLVLDTIGFATEYASGTYSRGARGFFIEGGELAYPIDEFSIAGTYTEMLGGIDAVASDLRFDASIVSPSFRVAEMTISGN